MDWNNLRNPVYQKKKWSTKDACMEYLDGTFYLFFSAFYQDRWKERSHVVGVKTEDWKHFSKPIIHLDGRENGWTGMCSPNISLIEGKYYLTFNSWGDRHPNKRKNQLFCMVSTNLEDWGEPYQVAKDLTEGMRAIDIAITKENGKFYVIWKADFKYKGKKVRKARISCGSSLIDGLDYIGDSVPTFLLENGKESTRIQENFEFIKIDGQWYLLSLDYRPHEPFLYKLSGDGSEDGDWLKWVDGRKLEIPMQSFNTDHVSNAPYLADWREYDGYFYLLYAGRTEGRSHKRRGNNKLGLARSKDLYNWEPLSE